MLDKLQKQVVQTTQHFKERTLNCLKTSLTRLFIGLAGLNLPYQGIFDTPGQLTSSGVPQSSYILFNCSGCNQKRVRVRDLIFNEANRNHKIVRLA